MQESQAIPLNDREIGIAGGWIRDRRLVIPCYDIDIALSKMTGKTLGDYPARFYRQNLETYEKRAKEPRGRDSGLSKFHTTKKNPSKSKKLETTRCTIFGLDIDLVNLRKEVYEEDSRIPGMGYGTADKDVFRGDATVNALFFNLEKQQVIDFTRRAKTELALGIIRTLLKPSAGVFRWPSESVTTHLDGRQT